MVMMLTYENEGMHLVPMIILERKEEVSGIRCYWPSDIVVTYLFRFPSTDVYVGCLQGSDFDYFNGSCSGFIGIGIKSEGIEDGWYDGGSIAFAVILVIVVTAISDYKQSLQFRNLNEEKRNIHLEVIRGGRRIEISIEIVVGDVIPLNIGNQVPADGILITGHSLAIDESSMTGESKIVHKDSKDPFLMSGCKVADGSGTMLVTGVGVNTGLLF
ncbi:calcium-transporting ATPase 8, plasma membrane-type-like [Arachis hypogaea]|uniref:calcium-transporting ATPase 8, plasma membrane-type-like n=1 Tax=Arachis hypogaea TaxID=3818 RepID=UPI003B21F852